MKLHRLLLAVATIALVGTITGEVQAQGFAGRTGLPWFGYGYSGSLYGLGRMPVPPYYSIHPPVYYSLPRARTYGQSPFAYSGDYHAPIRTFPRIFPNPHIEVLPLPAPEEAPAETTSSTARLITNPFYSAEARPESRLASQTD